MVISVSEEVLWRTRKLVNFESCQGERLMKHYVFPFSAGGSNVVEILFGRRRKEEELMFLHIFALKREKM